MDTAPDSAAEAGLVAAARRGDSAAFGRLYERYRRLVHGLLLARIPPDDAEERMQDVFTHAFTRLPALRDDEAFGPWIAAIARRAAVDFLRARGPAPEREALLDALPARGATDDAWLVLGAIRELPEAYRETLLLRLVEGLTGPEIAGQTGLTEGSVRVNLSRGMKLLRERLGGAAR